MLRMYLGLQNRKGSIATMIIEGVEEEDAC